jgi:hypothetical protein
VRVRHNLAAVAPAEAAPAPPELERADVVADFEAAGLPTGVTNGGPPPAGAETVLPLRIEVLMHLAEPNLTPAEREAIEEKVRDAVVDYVAAVPMGAPVVYAKLLARVAAFDEIADASLLVRPLDGAATPSEDGEKNIAAAGRKATIDRREVAVYLMDQRIALDVRVRVQERAGAPGTASQVTDVVRNEVRAAVERAIAPERTITRDAVRAAAGEALGATAPDLILAEEDPVVVNATYEESGRLVSDADQVVLAKHEVAAVDELHVDPIGVLDE